MEEARLAKASFYYLWHVNTKNKETGKWEKKPVQGPSIDMAMSFARNYGNAVTNAEVGETLTHYNFKASFLGFLNCVFQFFSSTHQIIRHIVWIKVIMSPNSPPP